MIPLFLHFIWISDKKPFGKLEYLSLLSALKNTPYQIYLHTNLQPGQAGIYDPFSLHHERFSILQQPFICEYRGIKVRPATLSDILRIKILEQYGGIYSDLDILWFKPIPFDLSHVRLLSTWQNQSYKILTNWILAAEKGYNFQEIYKNFDTIFDSLKQRNISSVDNDTLKDHLTLFKASGDFFKQHSDLILKRNYFGKNTWKNIWRFLTDQIPQEKIVLKDICGLHVCASNLFGEFRCNTSDLLTKHTELKSFCDRLLVDES